MITVKEKDTDTVQRELIEKALQEETNHPQPTPPNELSSLQGPEPENLSDMHVTKDGKFITKEELTEILGGIASKYEKLLKAAEGREDKLVVQLAKQTELAEAKSGPRTKIQKIINHNPRGVHRDIVERHTKGLGGRRPRFVNNNSDIRALRRGQGYDPILDENGKEVRHMDGVLMGIQRDRYEKEIREPKRDTKEFRRRAIAPRFKEAGKAHGVETFGGIEFDKGDA